MDKSKLVSFKNFPIKSNLCVTLLSSIGFYYDCKNQAIRCSECAFSEQNIIINTTAQLCINHANFVNSCVNLKYQSEYLLSTHDQQAAVTINSYMYKDESQRLKTFACAQFDFKTMELAKNGFFIQPDCISNSLYHLKQWRSFINATISVCNTLLAKTNAPQYPKLKI